MKFTYIMDLQNLTASFDCVPFECMKLKRNHLILNLFQI